ncbi:MAG: UDP-N-acetylmuramoyl-tripeptide--D-alanyl-D-alanine ligase, partial [Rhodospirillales bacterium]
MGAFDLSSLCQPLGGRVDGSNTRFSRVSIDTRTLKKGDLFVALKGENFDGHSFAPQAERAGACAAMVSSDIESSMATLKVENTLPALGQLARLNRARYQGPLVAITGSAGKTTTKNILSAIASVSEPTLATRGNLNNEIGVALTLLELSEQHQFAIVEMGAAKAGDISYLCGIACPDISVLLNAMPAHLSGFGSVEGVASAKGEIFAGLDVGNTAVINRDSPFFQLWKRNAGSAQIIDFGFDSSAAVSASELKQLPAGGMEFQLHTPVESRRVEFSLLGRHNVMNALAAVAAALAAEIDIDTICEGLRCVKAAPGRLFSLPQFDSYMLIDDSYNANPAAVMAAIDVLADYPGRRFLLLGDMGELGDESGKFHADIGFYALDKGVDCLWAVGELAALAAAAFGDSSECFDDKNKMVAAARKSLGSGDTVLIKGSRTAA